MPAQSRQIEMSRRGGDARAAWVAAAIALLATAACALGMSALAPAATAGAGARAAPRLGRVQSSAQSGFGDVRPQRIFLGGDPTGLVDGIRWSGWGSDRAIGHGDAEYDWPGTAVADNGPTPGARVVAFQLGTCRGRPSYNALEWYFPKYGQVFDPHEYLDTCTGATVGAPNVVSCPKNVRLADGAGTAAFIDVSAISCAAARRLIAQAPAAQYVVSGGRFMQSGFRCGTEGTRGGSSASFDCQRGQLEFAYMLTP
jgi:hypothetical protein